MSTGVCIDYEEYAYAKESDAYRKGYEQGKLDAVPAVRARWVKLYGDTEPVRSSRQIGWFCSECLYKRDIDADLGKAISCPNCGATMDWKEQ